MISDWNNNFKPYKPKRTKVHIIMYMWNSTIDTVFSSKNKAITYLMNKGLHKIDGHFWVKNDVDVDEGDSYCIESREVC